MWSRAFWLDALERAIRTFAQSLLTLLTAKGALALTAISWPDAFAIAGGTATVSLLMSILATGRSPATTASFLPPVAAAPPSLPPVSVPPSGAVTILPAPTIGGAPAAYGTGPPGSPGVDSPVAF